MNQHFCRKVKYLWWKPACFLLEVLPDLLLLPAQLNICLSLQQTNISTDLSRNKIWDFFLDTSPLKKADCLQMCFWKKISGLAWKNFKEEELFHRISSSEEEQAASHGITHAHLLPQFHIYCFHEFLLLPHFSNSEMSPGKNISILCFCPWLLPSQHPEISVLFSIHSKVCFSGLMSWF